MSILQGRNHGKNPSCSFSYNNKTLLRSFVTQKRCQRIIIIDIKITFLNAAKSINGMNQQPCLTEKNIMKQPAPIWRNGLECGSVREMLYGNPVGYPQLGISFTSHILTGLLSLSHFARPDLETATDCQKKKRYEIP